MMAMPHMPQDRELWAKAVANPDQLTTLEKRTLLRKADPATQATNAATNALKITGLTPEELDNKALTSGESMTYDEARLVQDGCHIWDTAEREANCTTLWPYEDWIAHITARVAVQTLDESAIMAAVSRRASDLLEARHKGITEKYNEDFKSNVPCGWVRKLIDCSVPWSEQTRRWGYVALRDEMTDCTHDAWERFLQVMDDHVYSGLVWMKGGSAIIPTKQLVFQDGFVAASDPEAVREFVRFIVPGSSYTDPETGVSRSEWRQKLTRILAS
jgi:hypothetical protein